MLYSCNIRYIGALGIITVLLGLNLACTTLSESPYKNTGSSQPPKNLQAANTKIIPGKARKPDSGLNDPAFKKLSPEVLQYLQTLSDAFYTHDLPFLFNQAEAFYKKTYEGLYSSDEYLAMLYRIGPYSTESGLGDNKKPVLNLNEVLGITYTGWDEIGPVLEVRGKILLTNGKSEHSRLILLWRLGDIKIKGFEP